MNDDLISPELQARFDHMERKRDLKVAVMLVNDYGCVHDLPVAVLRLIPELRELGLIEWANESKEEYKLTFLGELVLI